jgi:hypothetical protein
MVPSLNLEYIFVRMFQLLTNIPFDPGGFPERLVFLLETLATIGMVLAVVLLVMVVYVRVRFVQVEHYGFLALEEKERAKHIQDQQAAKNPRWEMIATLASSPNDSDWRRAILEADIMLAALLTERGYSGETVGEQLKNANPLQFTTINIAWEAHRMRNAIAHLGEAFPLSERDARSTIEQYRRVFEEFDYI